jgi:hypothetical protein
MYNWVDDGKSSFPLAGGVYFCLLDIGETPILLAHSQVDVLVGATVAPQKSVTPQVPFLHISYRHYRI